MNDSSTLLTRHLVRKIRGKTGLGGVLLVGLAVAFLPQTGWAGLGPVIELAPPDARPVRLDFGAGEIPLQGQGGGFAVTEFKTKKALSLQGGKVERRPDGSLTYHAMAGDLSLDATFVPRGDGSVRVSGLLKGGPGDRAIVLRYLVPMKTEGAIFGYDPGATQRVGPATETLVGTIFPVAGLAQDKACAAVAIPPSYPCCFGMKGTTAGLAVEFYLGLAAETKRFPDQARFEFLLFGADAAWPFRSALSRYFALFPEYFTPRVLGGGFWNKHEPGAIDAALPLYRFQVVGPGEMADVPRRHGFGVLSFDYLLVGNLKVKLAALPANYAAAMQAFADFARNEEKPAPGQKTGKATAGVIERSACKDAEGDYILDQIAKGASTAEGDKDEMAGNPGKARKEKKKKSEDAEDGGEGGALTFIVNPNPDLFAGQGVDTIGNLTIRHCQQLLASGPIDGFEFDSLGSRWPAHLNYRRDHFPYTNYPLTFDDQGRVAIHNQISHYECIEALRALTRPKDKFLFGNGIYTYSRKPRTEGNEQYNSEQNGRFFLAALLDVLGRENSALIGQTSLEQMRAMAGSKLYTMVIYKYNDPKALAAQMNRNLVYAVCGMPSNKTSGYVTSPLFARDQELLDWSLKNSKLLQQAGWQAVTDAHVDALDIGLERYGSGKNVYFALVNFGDAPRDCRLTIDLTALGGRPQDRAAKVQEIARGVKIDPEIAGGECRVPLRLAPNEAQIIQVSQNP